MPDGRRITRKVCFKSDMIPGWICACKSRSRAQPPHLIVGGEDLDHPRFEVVWYRASMREKKTRRSRVKRGGLWRGCGKGKGQAWLAEGVIVLAHGSVTVLFCFPGRSTSLLVCWFHSFRCFVCACFFFHEVTLHRGLSASGGFGFGFCTPPLLSDVGHVVG